ncbi:MAG: 30S ribosomal protein S17 [Proteobacteria bacterium]|nr:30S ribosomal protein S17 [Pseudomonadota bacterium]
MTGIQSRKTRTGVVMSTAMDKSVTVRVERTVKDPDFGKYLRRRKKYMAHDEGNECKKGDVVAIRECRPLSRRKRWRVVEILEKASEVE